MQQDSRSRNLSNVERNISTTATVLFTGDWVIWRCFCGEFSRRESTVTYFLAQIYTNFMSSIRWWFHEIVYWSRENPFRHYRQSSRTSLEATLATHCPRIVYIFAYRFQDRYLLSEFLPLTIIATLTKTVVPSILFRNENPSPFPPILPPHPPDVHPCGISKNTARMKTSDFFNNGTYLKRNSAVYISLFHSLGPNCGREIHQPMQEICPWPYQPIQEQSWRGAV